MNTDHSTSDKYIREHTPSLDDIIFTKREFLMRTGMGFGAMSLSAAEASLNIDGTHGSAIAERGFKLSLIGRYYPQVLSLSSDFAKARAATRSRSLCSHAWAWTTHMSDEDSARRCCRTCSRA